MCSGMAARLVVDVLPQQVHADDQQHVEFSQPLANLRRPERQALVVQRMIAAETPAGRASCRSRR